MSRAKRYRDIFVVCADGSAYRTSSLGPQRFFMSLATGRYFDLCASYWGFQVYRERVCA